MYDNKLGERIEKFLKHNEGKDFKSGEIYKALHLKKHKRRDLEDTLRKLKQKRKISGKNKRYYLDASTLSQEYIGIFDARPLAQDRSFAFVIREEGDIYISREDIMNAYDGDEVSVGIKFEGKGKLHGYITGIRQRARERVVGRMEKYQGRKYLIPDNSLLHSDFEIYDAGAAVSGEKIVCQITNWGDPDKRLLPGCKVIEILGKAGEPEVEIMSVICEYNLPLEFPESVMQEVSELDDGITEEVINERTDLRDIYTITIDPASARDYDDAISLERLAEGYRLYVHIADVAHYVNVGSALFEEALQRGNSYYFPRKVLPMLPEKLSNGICSLRPDEEKLTLTVISEYNADGYILDQKVVESVIESNARLAYEEVDDFMEKREHNLDEDTQKLILLMQELSAKLQKTRIERGYLSLDMPETEYIFDEEGHVIDLQRSRETESHQMIENFMLSANEYVAVTLSRSATLYRVHEAPGPDQLDDIKRLAGIYNFSFDLSHTINKAFQIALESLDTEDRHRVFDRVLLRHMKKARYDIINQGHFGLALQNYTHFTSPIRRICDLVVHHQIKALIKNSASDDGYVFTRSKLEDIAVIATEKEKLADTTEREVDTKNKLLFMKKRVGEEYSGVVIAVKAKGIIIEIDKYPVSGIVPLSSIKDDHYEYHAAYDTLLGIHKAQSIRLADRFKVILVKVDDDIIFEIKDK
ncbi:MAG: ribonuclease R [Candidatus Stygibacter australis]|nr:ribonuclease R [Candidatus Stygibacter australis]